MPFIKPVTISALSGDTQDGKLDSVVRQLGEWAAEISNEKIASTQLNATGDLAIVQGLQTINGVTVVGTVYYDTSGIPRILIGLAPDDNRPGIWISKEGQSVIDLLVA